MARYDSYEAIRLARMSRGSLRHLTVRRKDQAVVNAVCQEECFSLTADPRNPTLLRFIRSRCYRSPRMIPLADQYEAGDFRLHLSRRVESRV